MKITLLKGERKKGKNSEKIAREVKKSSSQAEKVIEVKRPIEGEGFEVIPKEINRNLFEKHREFLRHEMVRMSILEAFKEVDANPEEYAIPFETLVPKKTWNNSKTAEQLFDMATVLGTRNCDWVDLALYWAQRIHNGESWAEVCDKPDTFPWYRIVIWKDKKDARLVGGAAALEGEFSATNILCKVDDPGIRLNCAVPFVRKNLIL